MKQIEPLECVSMKEFKCAAITQLLHQQQIKHLGFEDLYLLAQLKGTIVRKDAMKWKLHIWFRAFWITPSGYGLSVKIAFVDFHGLKQ